MTLFIQKEEDRPISVNVPMVEADLDQDRREVYTLSLIFAILQETVNNQLQLAITSEKAQQANVDAQNKLNEALAECRLKDLPMDAYQMIHHHVPVYHTFADQRIKIGSRTDRISEHLVHPSKLLPVNAENNKQLKIRQDIQNSLAVFQQKGQVETIGAETNTKSSTQTVAQQEAFVNTMLIITKKIEGKRG